jgi:deoxycytidylate deaminase
MNIEDTLKIERLKSDHPTFKLSACIVLKKTILSIGHNYLTKTHPMIRKYDPYKTLHAELDAIIKVKNKEQLRGATIYIYREDRQGKKALAKPCPVCQKIIKAFGIKKMEYTTINGWYSEKV